MTIVGGGLLGHLKQGGLGLPGSKGKAGQVVLRARSRRAYSFEIYPREAVSDLSEVGVVYCYARAVPANAAAEASGAGLQIGYVGKTGDMGQRDAEHAARGDFTGHGFDIVLILRIEQAPIRTDIERDLIDTFNPMLNDLLRGVERGEAS